MQGGPRRVLDSGTAADGRRRNDQTPGLQSTCTRPCGQKHDAASGNDRGIQEHSCSRDTQYVGTVKWAKLTADGVPGNTRGVF